MDEATQALLADVPGIDRNDPAIQAALAVMRLEKPQAPRPSAEPPWLLKDLTETIASFLCPVDALALDASGSATRCVMVEGIVDGQVRVEFLGARDIYHAHKWIDVPLGGATTRLHTVGITFEWNDQGWGGQTLRSFFVWGASKKQSRCCASRCPWHSVFSGRRMSLRSR